MEVEIAQLADLPEGRGVRVDIGEERIAVFRIGETVHAIGDRCSHAEASLSEPVPVYPTVVRDGAVYVTIGGGS